MAASIAEGHGIYRYFPEQGGGLALDLFSCAINRALAEGRSTEGAQVGQGDCAVKIDANRGLLLARGRTATGPCFALTTS